MQNRSLQIQGGEQLDFKTLLSTSEYNFLRTNPRLGSRIMLPGISGSYGYGTNREGSDIDFRGVALNLPSDLIGLTSFDQYEDLNTDTVIFSFSKLVNLLLNCNPNTIESLGLDEDQYVIKTAVGQELLDHRHDYYEVNNAFRKLLQNLQTGAVSL